MRTSFQSLAAANQQLRTQIDTAYCKLDSIDLSLVGWKSYTGMKLYRHCIKHGRSVAVKCSSWTSVNVQTSGSGSKELLRWAGSFAADLRPLGNAILALLVLVFATRAIKPHLTPCHCGAPYHVVITNQHRTVCHCVINHRPL